ncbi:dihydrodipicolinate synthase family protein, partial [Bacillus haynesii]|uniref:dihydrodipicolinate synthase family protein n=1 Tax=Bacillus haynesii TaxID=1925021 RepID=UPI0022813CBD
MKVEGIIPAIMTPLTKQQAFHPEAAEKLVNRLIDSGVHGIFALGTNGEFHLFR